MSIRILFTALLIGTLMASCSTILVKERKTQRYFLFDENDRLCGWTNKATGEFKPDIPDAFRH